MDISIITIQHLFEFTSIREGAFWLCEFDDIVV